MQAILVVHACASSGPAFWSATRTCALLSRPQDCMQLVGLMPDHEFVTGMQRTTAMSQTQQLWTAKFPNEPFHVLSVKTTDFR